MIRKMNTDHLKDRLKFKILIVGILIGIFVISGWWIDKNRPTKARQYNVEMLSYEEYDEKFNLIDEGYTNFFKTYSYGSTELKNIEDGTFTSFLGSKEGEIDGIMTNDTKDEKIEDLSFFLENGFDYRMYDRGDVQLILTYEKFKKDKNNKDEYDIYVGFYDGSCYYPKEFVLEEDPEVCESYLQGVLDELNYDTVEEMLLTEFKGLLVEGDK